MRRNMLGGETSPYLLQHKDNPVHWQVWGAQTLSLARAENKPILLSVGYAACHWCHVMAHECFEDPAIAALMNDLFIPIKIDREERPDIDTIYQTALALQGQPGGWPLTMFLTPDGHPFWGGTYFPPTPRFGRPSFPEILNTISTVYRQDPQRITNSVASIGRALEDISAPRSGADQPPPSLERIAALVVPNFDPIHGGRQGAPKFPEAPLLSLIWRAHRKTADPDFGQTVRTTLDHICQGGIYDHLGGGFARYATDSAWLVPHFEKMLYDNAQLVTLLTLVWQAKPSPLYAARIEQTISWVLREMTLPGGGFAGSLDADSEGGEGSFYLWTAAEIDALLGPQAENFKKTYGVKPAGNWEGKNILHRLAAMDWAGADEERRLADCRSILMAARAPRPRPATDDKVLTDWNAMMIAALAQAADALQRDDWREAAEKAYGFIMGNLFDGQRLMHSWRQDQCRGGGVLDDYAQMASAAMALFSATGQADYLANARHFVATLERYHWDHANGGYFLTPHDAEDLIMRTRTAHDGATPSGNGTMAEVLARLYHLTGEDVYRQRAEQLIASFANRPPEDYAACAALMCGAELLAGAVQTVIVGGAGDPATGHLRRAAIEAGLPGLVLQRVEPGASLPANHPARAMTGRAQIPTAYVCYGNRCGPPLTDAADLKDALAKL